MTITIIITIITIIIIIITIITIKINEKMPHNIDCPKDINEFDNLIDRYVNTSIDMEALVTRVVAWNSVHLPGAQG